MRRRWIPKAALVVTAMSILFCTFGSPGGTGAPAGSISDGERMAALDDIAQSVEASKLPDGQIDRGALLELLQKDARFGAAGKAPDGSIWANFQDGRLVMVPPQTPISPELAELPEASDPGPRDSASIVSPVRRPAPGRAEPARGGKTASVLPHQQSTPGNLPASDTAVVLSAFGAGYPKTTSLLRSWLSRSGYTVLPIKDGSVENLKLVQGVGVFYLEAHGGMICTGTRQDCEAIWTPAPGSLATPTGRLSFSFGFRTSTPVTEANEKAYARDLKERLMGYSLMEQDLNGPVTWTYAITGLFIQSYMTFSDDSLVFLNSCSSAAGGLEGSFTIANASVMLGWSDVAALTDRPIYFFDRLLGINWDHGYEKVDQHAPPNRPFGVDLVFWAMQAKTTTPIQFTYKGTAYTTHLELRRMGGAFAILRPTIESLFVHESKDELELWGRFGDKEGTVTIDGKEVTVKQWQSTKILVTLPAADAEGGSGDVVVRVRDHLSNPVPLTLWHAKFMYTEEPDFEMKGYNWLNLDVYWRADVHPFRASPDGDVHDQDAVKLEPAEGSSGRWSCDWEGMVATLSITTIEGEGDLPFTRQAGAVGFTSTAKLNPETKQITNLQFFVTFDEDHTCVTETTGAGYTTRTALGFVLLPSLLQEVTPDYPVTPPLKLNGQWSLQKGNRDLNGDDGWPWLEWPDTPGEPAPVMDKTPG